MIGETHGPMGAGVKGRCFMGSMVKGIRTGFIAILVALFAIALAVGWSIQPACADEGDVAAGAIASGEAASPDAAETCTITFDAACDGVTVEPLVVAKGTQVTTRGRKVDDTSVVSISFTTRTSEYNTTDIAITAPDDLDSRRYFKFWSTSPDRLNRTSQIDSFATKSMMDEAPDTFTVDEDMTLYAAWYTKENYDHSLNGSWQYFANGGEGSMANAVVNEQYIVVDACSFTRPGYTFVRWSTLPDGSGVSYLPGQRYFIASWSQPLYAIWQDDSAPDEPSDGSMYRMYNPWSGEHFYTSSNKERLGVRGAGWEYEGVGWKAPESGNPVYRLYNPYMGDHHYTLKEDERDSLIAVGWVDEGVGWFSDPGESVPLYREYNPNELSHNHNYTADKAEHDALVSLGWVDEGKAWYGV